METELKNKNEFVDKVHNDFLLDIKNLLMEPAVNNTMQNNEELFIKNFGVSVIKLVNHWNKVNGLQKDHDEMEIKNTKSLRTFDGINMLYESKEQHMSAMVELSTILLDSKTRNYFCLDNESGDAIKNLIATFHFLLIAITPESYYELKKRIHQKQHESTKAIKVLDGINMLYESKEQHMSAMVELSTILLDSKTRNYFCLDDTESGDAIKNLIATFHFVLGTITPESYNELKSSIIKS